MSNESFENEDDIKKRLLAELNEENLSSSYKEDDVSIFGRSILAELEIKEHAENSALKDLPDYNPVHQSIQDRFEKTVKATRMITGYISRKNEKNLVKEEVDDAVSVMTEGNSLLQSKIMNGSIFDQFEPEFKEDIYALRNVKNPIFGRNRIEEMKAGVQEELQRYKDNNKHIFEPFDSDELDLSQSEDPQQDVEGNSGDENYDILATNFQLDAKMKEFEEDRKQFQRQYEWTNMAEADREGHKYRTDVKAQNLEDIKNSLLGNLRLFTHPQFASPPDFSKYFIPLTELKPTSFRLPQSTISEESILKVEKNEDLINNRIKAYYSGRGIINRKTQPSISQHLSKIQSNKEPKKKEETKMIMTCVEIQKEVSRDRKKKRLEGLDRCLIDLKSHLQKHNLLYVDEEEKMTPLEELREMYLTGLFSKSSLLKKISIEDQGMETSIGYFRLIHFNVRLEKYETLQEILKENENKFKRIDILEVMMNGISNLSLNNLLDPPENVRELIEISLSNNNLSNIDQLREFSNLRIIDASSNQLEEFPNIKLKRLTKLIVSNNKINKISNLEGFPDLRELIASGNQIAVMENLSGCYRLEVLDLSRNQLTDLPALPSLQCLHTLLLFGNAISTLASELTLLSLSTLHLSSNQLSTFPSPSGGSACVLPLLSRLSLRSNNLMSLPSFAGFEGFAPFLFLSSLSLSFNPLPLSSLAPYLVNCPHLKELEFFGVKGDTKEMLEEEVRKHTTGTVCVNGSSLAGLRKIIQHQHNTEREEWAWGISRAKEEVEKAGGGREAIGVDCGFLRRQQGWMVSKLKNRANLFVQCLFSSKAYKEMMDLLSTKLYLDKTNQRKLKKVKDFLKRCIQKRRTRNQHFRDNINKIIQLQSNIRGHISRRKFDFYRDPLVLHRKHLSEIIRCQKLMRGFLIRRRYSRMFTNLKYKDELSFDQDEMFDFFEGDLDIETGLDIPQQMMNLLANPTAYNPKPLKSSNPKIEKKHSIQNNASDAIINPIRIASNLNLDSSNTSEVYSSRRDSDSVSILSLSSQGGSAKQKKQFRLQSNPSQVTKPKLKPALKVVEEWGFKDEDAKHALQFRIMRERNRKKKQKKLTAEERYKLFVKNSKT